MNKELLQKDKEEKAIKFYKNYIENQEKELDWMYKQNEEYYRDEIEQKELLIKGFRTILNLIQKQEKIIDKTWDLYYEYLSIRPASGMKFLKSKGFDVSKCEKCSFDDDNINCKECIKEYFKKEVEKE